MTPLRAWSHACPAETWGVRGEGQAEAVRSREDVLVGVVAALLAFGLVFRNLQAVGSSPAMAVPKKDSVRLVGDLLSRWVSVPALPVCAVAVFSPCDHSMPSKAVCSSSATESTCDGWHGGAIL